MVIKTAPIFTSPKTYDAVFKLAVGGRHGDPARPCRRMWSAAAQPRDLSEILPAFEAELAAKIRRQDGPRVAYHPPCTLQHGLALALGQGAQAEERGNAAEASALVKKAVAYVKANGKDKAFAEFNNPKGQFVDRNLYIFVYDLKGTSLAIGNGNNAKMVGKDRSDMRDADGTYIIKGLIAVANTKGSGWFDYKWPNPLTKAVEVKSSYVEKLDDIMIGCGIYKTQ